MVDIKDRAARSRNMKRIGAKDSAIEVLVRTCLHKRGFRYRKNLRFPINLSGKKIRPEADIYLRKYRAVVQVNGCYWHNHGCRLSKKPLSEMTSFWRKKLAANKSRDQRNILAFNSTGLKVMTVWECALRDKSSQEIAYVLRQVEDWIRFGVGNASIAEESDSVVGNEGVEPAT